MLETERLGDLGRNNRTYIQCTTDDVRNKPKRVSYKRTRHVGSGGATKLYSRVIHEVSSHYNRGDKLGGNWRREIERTYFQSRYWVQNNDSNVSACRTTSFTAQRDTASPSPGRLPSSRTNSIFQFDPIHTDVFRHFLDQDAPTIKPCVDRANRNYFRNKIIPDRGEAGGELG